MSERHDHTPAALYARVSSDRQDVDLSVAAQLRALRDHARKNGYMVVREFVDEAESGRIADRPQFRKMIDEAGRPPSGKSSSGNSPASPGSASTPSPSSPCSGARASGWSPSPSRPTTPAPASCLREPLLHWLRGKAPPAPVATPAVVRSLRRDRGAGSLSEMPQGASLGGRGRHPAFPGVDWSELSREILGFATGAERLWRGKVF